LNPEIFREILEELQLTNMNLSDISDKIADLVSEIKNFNFTKEDNQDNKVKIQENKKNANSKTSKGRK
jgi:hypothetical protein